MASPPRKSASPPGASLLLPGWEFACRVTLGRFRRQLAAGPDRNAATLRGILRRNAATEFGRRHDFARIARSTDVELAYRQSVPVGDYAAFFADIQRMVGGERDVLIPGHPRMFVSTSGTTGDPKLFPVTLRQQNEALRFIALLTPAARAAAVPGLGFRRPTATLMVASRPGRVTPTGIPVGNPSGAGIRRILKLAPPFWVFPPEVLTVTDYPTALYLHALFALRAADLGCIEAIYCSHVVNWMGLIERRQAELIRDIAEGGLSPDLELSPGERESLASYLAPDPERAGAVGHELTRGAGGLMTRLWPELRVLSTVLSGAFAVSVPRLRELAGPGPALYTTCFGATEGMVGINLRGDRPEQYVLALGALYFEFLPVAGLDAGEPVAAGMADVHPGESYELVITTHAGLYRYRLGDVVRVTGFEGTTPIFEFDHRRGNVIDLVGEKTTEQHVRTAIGALAREFLGGEAGLVDFTVFPDIAVMPYRYVVYLEPAANAVARLQDPAVLASRLDTLLAEGNPAYGTLGRQNGRLDGPLVRFVPPGTFAEFLNTQRAAAAGGNANQVKVPKVLRVPAQRALLEQAALGCS